MATRNTSKNLKKQFMKGSAAMYQDANSIMDQVTNRAMGIKTTVQWSNLKLSVTSNVELPRMDQVERIVSDPWQACNSSGRRLTKKAS